MIRKYKIPLKAENGRLRPEHAYALYGELMSRIDGGVADELHTDGFTPISQHLESGINGAEWIVSTFDDDVSEAFLDAINDVREITLRDSGIKLSVSEAVIEPETDFEQLLSESADEPRPAWRRIEFTSPTGFKSEEQHVLFPTSDLILKSLILKWNAACPDYLLEDEELMKMLLSGVSISGYRLASYDYRMKNQHIRSFTGSVTLRAKLSAPLEKLYEMLLRFGGYSGGGIKTALGMGGMKVLEK